MDKPRIILVDEDYEYLVPLELKFTEEFFNQIDLEIITKKEYYDQLFSKPQEVDVLVVTEDFYTSDIQKHSINNIFVTTEQPPDGQTEDLSINHLFKYTSVKEIFNEIVSKSAESLQIDTSSTEEPQIILVYSASGGVGKSTVALGLASCLTKNFKKTLYINASRLQNFQHFFENQTPISNSQVYSQLTQGSDRIYQEIKHVIRNESFDYLPPLKSSLLSLDIPYSMYEEIAVSAKKSYDYDFIILDCDSVFDEDKTHLINIADRVVIVTNQTKNAVRATNQLVSNLSGVHGEKYLFICNDYDEDKDNSLISGSVDLLFQVNDYIKHFSYYDRMSMNDFVTDSDMQRMSFLVI